MDIERRRRSTEASELEKQKQTMKRLIRLLIGSEEFGVRDMNVLKTSIAIVAAVMFCGTAWADMSPNNFRPHTLPPPADLVTYNPNPVNLPPGYFLQDYVDIGKPASELAHGINPGGAGFSWGPIQPLTSGGTWGGENDCRVIWDNATGSTSATYTMNFGNDPRDKYIAVRWLDGLSGGDSFELYVSNVLKATVNNGKKNPEAWWDLGVWNVGQQFGVKTIKLVATDPQWTGFGLWGQVAFSESGVYAIPVPGAALLGVIGLSTVAWIRRRFS